MGATMDHVGDGPVTGPPVNRAVGGATLSGPLAARAAGDGQSVPWCERSCSRRATKTAASVRRSIPIFASRPLT